MRRRRAEAGDHRRAVRSPTEASPASPRSPGLSHPGRPGGGLVLPLKHPNAEPHRSILRDHVLLMGGAGADGPQKARAPAPTHTKQSRREKDTYNACGCHRSRRPFSIGCCAYPGPPFRAPDLSRCMLHAPMAPSTRPHFSTRGSPWFLLCQTTTPWELIFPGVPGNAPRADALRRGPQFTGARGR